MLLFIDVFSVCFRLTYCGEKCVSKVHAVVFMIKIMNKV